MVKRSGRGRRKGHEGKFLSLREVAERVAAHKAAGRRVVHCHGVFDLLHVGHIRHFEAAKALGDVLVVTLTPDRHVNKGPHRPAFPQELRAEVIESLKAVDYVAINEWSTAVKTIRLIRPDVYAKGSDYKNAKDDLTGKIVDEERAVRSVGGEIRFTDDITFSSSNLLNRHMQLFGPEVRTYLKRLRARRSAGEIIKHLDGLRGAKVLVVGEAILDEYVYCDALGKSSKEPILAMLYRSKDVYAGGTLAIANHAAEFAGKVDLITALGDRNTEEAFVRRSLKKNVRPFFVKKPDSPTLVKRRFVERYVVTKLLEIYDMNDAPLSGRPEKTVVDRLRKTLSSYDAVIVADYGHGLITPKMVKALCGKARFLSVNTQINAANIGFHAISKYPKADYVCIHEGELRLEHRSREGSLRAMMQELVERMGCGAVMVTRGKNGTELFVDGKGFSRSPSFAIKIVDRVGAGDAVLALTSLCVSRKVPPDITAFLGNLAGAQAVQFVGNSASINGVGLRKAVESLLR